MGKVNTDKPVTYSEALHDIFRLRALDDQQRRIRELRLSLGEEPSVDQLRRVTEMPMTLRKAYRKQQTYTEVLAATGKDISPEHRLMIGVLEQATLDTHKLKSSRKCADGRIEDYDTDVLDLHEWLTTEVQEPFTLVYISEYLAPTIGCAPSYIREMVVGRLGTTIEEMRRKVMARQNRRNPVIVPLGGRRNVV